MLGSQDVSASRHTKRNGNVSRLDHYCIVLVRVEALPKTHCAKLGRRTNQLSSSYLCTTSRDRSASDHNVIPLLTFSVLQPAIVNFSIPHESMHASAPRPVPRSNPHSSGHVVPQLANPPAEREPRRTFDRSHFRTGHCGRPECPAASRCTRTPPSSSRCMDFVHIVSRVHRSVVRPWWCGRCSMFAVKPEDNDVRVSIEDRQRRPNHLNTHQQL